MVLAFIAIVAIVCLVAIVHTVVAASRYHRLRHFDIAIFLPRSPPLVVSAVSPVDAAVVVALSQARS